MIVEAQLSIIFNTHSPCLSVTAVKPSSVQVNLALSSLDEDLAGIEVEGVVALEALYLEILSRIDISSISSSEKPVFALLQTIALNASFGR